MDIELIRELFENCQRAAEILGTDAEFRTELKSGEDRLPPLQIGKRGQLQEWIEDYPEVEAAHRHVSHLYSLYPGHDISFATTPEFAAAAKRASNCEAMAALAGPPFGEWLCGRGSETRSMRITTCGF